MEGLRGHLSKAASRRFQAAFAKVPMCWLVELGPHAPLAAVIGLAQESEWALAHRLLAQLPTGCLLLADRRYGVGAFVNELTVVGQTVGSQWLVRVRQNLKCSVRQVLADGSALVAVAVPHPRYPNRKAGFVLVRQIVGRVRRPGGAWVTVRLWTSLLDASTYPAAELLALYARRWDIEVFTKELKVPIHESRITHHASRITHRCLPDPCNYDNALRKAAAWPWAAPLASRCSNCG